MFGEHAAGLSLVQPVVQARARARSLLKFPCRGYSEFRKSSYCLESPMARPALALLLTGAKADAWSVAPLMRASVHFCAAQRVLKHARRQARAGVSSCARPVTHEDTPNFTWYDTFMDISLQQSSINERKFYFPCLIKAALDRETAAIIDPALARLDQLWWDSFQPLPPEVRVQI